MREKRSLARGMAIAVGLAFIALAGGFLAAGNYFYEVAVARNRKDLIARSDDLAANRAPSRAFSPAFLETAATENVTIRSADGLALHAIFIPAPAGGTRAAILAHGYSADGRTMGGFARFFSEGLGYAVLLPDARGHGKSEGDYIGFGWPDRLDIAAWAAWLEARLGAGAAIVLHGVSMGGATVLMASAEDLPASVRAIVSDCAYTSAEAELSWQLGRMYHLPPWPLLPALGLVTRLRAGYALSKASAIGQVRMARLPILFIHGQDDSFVPFEMVGSLYEACPTGKELLVVPGAGHGLAYDTDPAGYEARISAFLAKYL